MRKFNIFLRDEKIITDEKIFIRRLYIHLMRIFIIQDFIDGRNDSKPKDEQTIDFHL
jgi:hypothetical protein